MDTYSQFPPFSLERLLRTVFAPKGGERVVVLIDLPNPAEMAGFQFLSRPELTIQRHAHDVVYLGLKNGVMEKLGLSGGEMHSYAATGGSNLDLPEMAFGADGVQRSLAGEVLPKADLVLCVSTYSATAPLTALAKRIGFRGATMHGMNEIILKTGLAVDYNQVSVRAEALRLAMTRADWFEIDFEFGNQPFRLRLICDGQEAQKSHGLCRGAEPDVANLPAGEVYYVPNGAEGAFPFRYPDGTYGRMEVAGGRITQAVLLRGDPRVVNDHNRKLKEDPATGELGELGFGTQSLPPSGRDIQDEKILGTLHVATGRSDHLGGSLDPARFKHASNATHEDILFSPTKTPEIRVPEVRMSKGGVTTVLIQNYEICDYLKQAIATVEASNA